MTKKDDLFDLADTVRALRVAIRDGETQLEVNRAALRQAEDALQTFIAHLTDP